MLTRCPSCNDELPTAARFCIECGRTVAATGETERIATTGATKRLDDGIEKEPITAEGLQALSQRAFERGAERIIIAVRYDDVAAISSLTGFIEVSFFRRGRATRDETLSNRLLGIYQAAEIWIKPWAVQGYACMQEAR
jgi:hypothetical protein